MGFNTDFDTGFIGHTVKKFRVESGRSQGDVCKRSKIQRSHLSRIENGHATPDLDTLIRIGQAIEVPAWEMLKEAEERMGFQERNI